MVWILAILSSFLIGLSRGGLKGIGPLFAILMVFAFGGKTSTGIILPLLLLGDLCALAYYKDHIQKKYILSFLPWLIIGVCLGTWIGAELSDQLFKEIIAVLVFSSMLLLWLWEYYLKVELKSGFLVTMFTGLGAGIFSMLGNFAGAFGTIYFLLTGLRKRDLIGTATLVFFIINVVKVPFHVFVWETISADSFRTSVMVSPALLIGFLVGIKIINRISEAFFRQFLYVVTILGAISVFVS